MLMDNALSALRTFGQRVQPYLPAAARIALKNVYHAGLMPLTYASAAKLDADALAKAGLPFAPPPAMRHRVAGSPDINSFLFVGEQNFAAIQAGLTMAGINIKAESNVLDFGCGSGRTLLWWLKDKNVLPKLFATDIDREAIEWVGEHFPAKVNVNKLNPPLHYVDKQMDVVYAISVFTHLNELAQDAWLAELRRITKQDGILLLSIHSALGNEVLNNADKARLDDEGILFRRDYMIASDIFSEGYQNTYHSIHYIEEHWGKSFDIVGRVEMGRQDLLVLRRN